MNETKALSDLFLDLKVRLKDDESLEILRALKSQMQEAERESKRALQAAEAEIDILKRIGPVSEGEAKFRLADQERELKELKSELIDRQFELDSLHQSNLDLAKENDVLLQHNQLLSQQSAKARGLWVWSVENLETERKILAEEINKIELRFRQLLDTWSNTAQAMEDNTAENSRRLAVEFSEEIYRALTNQKQNAFHEERLLLTGLFHYIQNHVSAILGSSEMLSERARRMIPATTGKLITLSSKQLQKEVEFLGDVLQEKSDKVRKLQKGLADFSSLLEKRDLKLEKISLTAVLEGFLAANEERLAKAKVTVSKSFPSRGFIFSDQKCLEEALQELLNNSLEAQPAGGAFSIEGKMGEPEGTVQISIKDSGPGIPHHQREKIFYPFFTTKEGHAGLGLSRAVRLVALAGGALEARPQAKGAEFLIRFPQAQAS